MKNFKLLCLLSLFLLGCAQEKPKGKTDAEILFREAQRLVGNKRYIMATERLNTLRSQYPYSFYATHAELLLADILFNQESYVEAASAYILFKDFHPRNKRINYVVWRIAESYYEQIPSTFDRDLTAATEAIKYYRELIQKYPGYVNIEDAKKKIKRCYDLLRKKEKYIADFYFKTHEYSAARYRYLDIMKRIRNKEMRQHAMARIILSSEKLNEHDKCRAYGQKFEKYIADKDKKEVQKALDICNMKKPKKG